MTDPTPIRGPRLVAKGKLTVKEVQSLRAPGRYADGDRLYLWVRPSGARVWLFRYQSPVGRKRDMVLGDVDDLGLADARARAADARAKLAAGLDPLEVKHEGVAKAREADRARRAQAKADRTTLARVARAYHERIAPKFRNAKHAAQWINSLEQHVPAELWGGPIASAKPAALIDFLTELHRKVPETAARVQQRLAVVFADAQVRELIVRDPLPGVAARVRELVGKRAKGRFTALPYRDAPAMLTKLRTHEGSAARALELLLLTAARTGEAIGAQWGEFDLDAGTWVVPGARMKGGEPHTVFLPDAAVELVRKLPRVEDSPYVFPSPMDPSQPLSNMALLALLDRMKMREQTTVHGLRACFSTWANETTQAKPDVIEACLAHREGDRVRAAYNRATFDADRKPLLAAWARYLSRAADVRQLREAA